MHRKLLLFFTAALVFYAGCGNPARTPPRHPKQPSSPTIESKMEVSIAKIAAVHYEPNFFNDMFYKHPIEPLGGNSVAFLAPSVVTDEDGDKKGKVSLELIHNNEQKTLFSGDANNWLLRSPPDKTLLSWLTWRGEDEKEHCSLLTLPLEGGEPKEVLAFPAGSVVLDYLWFDSEFVYALLVYDDALSDVRLVVGNTNTKETKEVINTGGFPILAERDSLGIPGNLCFSRSRGVGYFSALGCIFAFEGKTSLGGLFLDGNENFFLTSPQICDDGRRLSFYAVALGGERFFNCEMDIKTTSFIAFKDRSITYRDSAADFLFTCHSFYYDGRYSVDLLGSGNGMISLESPESGTQVLVKVEKNALSLIRGSQGQFFSLTPDAYYRYTITGLNIQSGFPSSKWSAASVMTAAYPKFNTPEATLRSYLSALCRGDANVWSVCQRDPSPTRWVTAVGVNVASRSLKLEGMLRGYVRIKTVFASSGKVVMEGEVEAFGNSLGRETFTLVKLGDIWLVESCKPVEKP